MLLPSPEHLRLYWWICWFWRTNEYAPSLDGIANALGTYKVKAQRMVADLEAYGLVRTHGGRPRGVVPVSVEDFLAGLPGRLRPLLAAPTDEDLKRLIELRKTGEKQPRKPKAQLEPLQKENA